MPSGVNVFIDEHGKIDSVSVHLDINGHPEYLEFGPDSTNLWVLFPEDADTIHDEFICVDSVVIPEKPEVSS